MRYTFDALTHVMIFTVSTFINPSINVTFIYLKSQISSTQELCFIDCLYCSFIKLR